MYPGASFDAPALWSVVSFGGCRVDADTYDSVPLVVYAPIGAALAVGAIVHAAAATAMAASRLTLVDCIRQLPLVERFYCGRSGCDVPSTCPDEPRACTST